MIILYYSFCSSTMLVINKVTIYYLPAPTFVLFCQLAASTLVVKAGGVMGMIEVDKLEWAKVRKFIWVVVGFLGTIFANIKVLQNSNVETFITFRSSTPLILSLCDYAFLGRAWPNTRSWSCLTVLLMGSVGYVMFDSGYQVSAYLWLVTWYVFFTFDSVYVKHMCETLKMTSWGRVYYTNFMAMLFLLPVLPILGEHILLSNVVWSTYTVAPLLLSCTIGVGMSHASYLLRDAVSATMFTIVGICCKIVTVIINYFLWDKHASLEGIGCLMVCVLASTFYQQAPKRA
ncbi:MAG: hypothetical protein WDW38_003726 [Sanguina aurantia]